MRVRDLDQSMIMFNMTCYLEMMGKYHPDVYKEHDVLYAIKCLQEGHCFGFSVINSVMAYVGKHDWWLGLMAEIAGWDHKAGNAYEQLTQAVALPAEVTSRTLGQLFELAISWVRLIQDPCVAIHNDDQKERGNRLALLVSRITESMLKQPNLYTASQCDVLQPGVGVLEVSSADNSNNQAIVERRIFCRYYTKSAFADLLDKLQTCADILLIHYDDHVVSVRHDGSDWYLYDSNHDTLLDHYEKKFNKSNLIFLSMIIDHSNDFAIEAATFSQSKATSLKKIYQDFSHEADLSFMKGLSLHYMAELDSNILSKLLLLVKSDEQYQKLIECLCRVDYFGQTGWHILSKYTPHVVSRVINNIPIQSYGQSVDSFCHVNTDGVSGLEAILPFLSSTSVRHLAYLVKTAKQKVSILNLLVSPKLAKLLPSDWVLLVLAGNTDWHRGHVFVTLLRQFKTWCDQPGEEGSVNHSRMQTMLQLLRDSIADCSSEPQIEEVFTAFQARLKQGGSALMAKFDDRSLSSGAFMGMFSSSRSKGSWSLMQHIISDRLDLGGSYSVAKGMLTATAVGAGAAALTALCISRRRH